MAEISRSVTIEDHPRMMVAIRAHLARIAMTHDERQQERQPSPTVPVKISGVDFDGHVIALATQPHGYTVEGVALAVDIESKLGGDGPQAVIICKDDQLAAAAHKMPYGEQAFSPVTDVITYPDYWSIPRPPELFAPLE